MEAASIESKAGVTKSNSAWAFAWNIAWQWVRRGRWSLYAVYLGAAFLLTGLYWETTIQLHTATIEMFVAGTANKPFAYRVLMPWLLGLVSGLNNIEDLKLVDVSLRVTTLFGTFLLLRFWLRYFVHPLLADVGPFLLGIILPWSFLFYWPYDFSGLLLWTACLICLVQRKYVLYLLLFALSTLNRETAFFLIGIFAATQWEKLGWRRTLQWTSAQFAVWLGIFISLRMLIHPIAGDPVEIHMLDNFVYLTRGYGYGPFEHWLQLLSGLGFLWLLAPWRWAEKSTFLKRACWVLPFHAASLFIVGRLVETRMWYEWIPIALAMSGQSLMAFAKQDASSILTAD